MSILARVIPLLLVLSGCALQQGMSFQPTPQEARLVELMGDRLAIANEVAWIKYSSQLPVRDGKREQEVLDKLALLAKRHGMNVGTARRFFSQQIIASREQQEEDIRRWRAGATLPVRAPASLHNDIRPRIDALDGALISTLAQLGRPRAGLSAFAYAAFRHAGFPRPVSSAAARPLR